MEVNPEIDQDRVFDTVEHFAKFGCVMFPEQVQIYKNIALEVESSSVLEAGCGNGLGSAILERRANYFIATDKLQRNIDFARQLYPWVNFDTWDINYFRGDVPVDHVVCIEAFEHVKSPKEALKYLSHEAEQTLWISTPNGTGKPRPPKNPYHVCEYTPGEMLEMIGKPTEILHWKTFEKLPVTTKVDPLVYKIQV